MRWKRISIVGNMTISNISESSTFQVGDSAVIQARNRVFAVQREVATFWSNEGNFNLYPIFSRPIEYPPILEGDNVTMSVDNLGSTINVGNVRILAISSSSVTQVGSNRVIEADNRILNIRQYIRPNPGDGKKPSDQGNEPVSEGPATAKSTQSQ
jgi:spore germination protein PE